MNCIIKLFNKKQTMEDRQQKFNDLTTEHTDNSSIASKQQTIEHPFMNKIMESTQEIINNQAVRIFQLNNELKNLKKENETLKIKYDTLIKKCQENNQINLDEIILKITQLQNQLINTKMELAVCKAQNLELRFTGMKNQKASLSSSIIQPIKYPEIEKFKMNLQTKSKLQVTDDNLNTSQWIKMVENYLTGFPRVQRFKQKTLDLIKKGIPHDLRESLWPLIFQNKIGITNSLYSELLERRQKDGNYTKRVLSQINKDICRSFNGKTQFDTKVGLNTEVTEILQVFHIYRPDVSYVQGMTYPVIVLNLIVGKYKAFWIFCNLILGNQFFRKIYTFQPNYLACYCRAFEVLLQQKLPKVTKLLALRGIQSQVYLVQWFYTFFSRGLSYQFTLKIWDLLAYEQELLFYKLALSIFELLQSYLFELQMEQTITVIRQFSAYMTEQKLQQVLFAQKLTNEKLEKTFEKVFKKQIKGQ